MKLKRVRGMCVHLLRLASLLGARCCTAWRAVCSITPLTMCRVLPVCVVVPQGMTAVSAAEALTGALPCVKRQVCVCLRLRHAPPALLSCTAWCALLHCVAGCMLHYSAHDRAVCCRCAPGHGGRINSWRVG